MCGIAGIFDTTGSTRVDPQTIHAMCAAMVHRGPDKEGIHVDGSLGLGSRRLSIIDLSTGQQPIHNEDGNLWIVFNGEIYNFQALRPGLEARGHHFSTYSDTEVILHLYEELGAKCVEQLRGMFALAIYDKSARRLFIARDRLGKKPLYYSFYRNRFIFGSEIKVLLEADPGLKEVDDEGLLQYFYFGYIPDPLTSFKHIKKLPPGHSLEVSEGGLRISKYWDLPEFG